MAIRINAWREHWSRQQEQFDKFYEWVGPDGKRPREWKETIDGVEYTCSDVSAFDLRPRPKTAIEVYGPAEAERRRAGWLRMIFGSGPGGDESHLDLRRRLTVE